MKGGLTMAVRHKRGKYFERLPGMPAPLYIQVKRRVMLSEVDVLGIVWHGRYAQYIEEASAALGRKCGLSYLDYRQANLRAPIVQYHVDYYLPLKLEDEITVRASLVWCEGARLNTEFELTRKDSEVATAGFTVQMFLDGTTGETCLVPPELVEKCRRRWKAGEFKCLQ